MPNVSTNEVALFVTCLVDLFRPNIGFAAIHLLQQCDFDVVVPKAQTCCGQPAFNSGDKPQAIALAQQLISQFGRYSAVVVPSGSCAGMMIKHYPALFEPTSPWHSKAKSLAGKTHELLSFIHAHQQRARIAAEYRAVVCYHHSCAGLRELNIRHQATTLLQRVKGLRLTPLTYAEVCCGFGGTFCVKFDQVSNKMAADKVRDVAASGADTLLAGDLGCLMAIAGKLRREHSAVKVWHAAEVLAGFTQTGAIAETPAPGVVET